MARYNRIFAALDGADTQEAVIRRAFSIAHDNDAEVVLGHVIDSALFETGGVRGDQIAKTNEEAIRKELALFLARAEQDEHVPSVDIQVRVGRIGETLVDDLIEGCNPDLVICGVRGLSSVKYAFVGSVSTYVIRHCKCDVLVVNAAVIEDIPNDEYASLGLLDID